MVSNPKNCSSVNSEYGFPVCATFFKASGFARNTNLREITFDGFVKDNIADLLATIRSLSLSSVTVTGPMFSRITAMAAINSIMTRPNLAVGASNVVLQWEFPIQNGKRSLSEHSFALFTSGMSLLHKQGRLQLCMVESKQFYAKC